MESKDQLGEDTSVEESGVCEVNKDGSEVQEDITAQDSLEKSGSVENDNPIEVRMETDSSDSTECTSSVSHPDNNVLDANSSDMQPSTLFEDGPGSEELGHQNEVSISSKKSPEKSKSLDSDKAADSADSTSIEIEMSDNGIVKEQEVSVSGEQEICDLHKEDEGTNDDEDIASPSQEKDDSKECDAIDTSKEDIVIVIDDIDEEVSEEDHTISIDIRDEHQNEFSVMTGDEKMEYENSEITESSVFDKEHENIIPPTLSEKSTEKTVEIDKESMKVDSNLGCEKDHASNEAAGIGGDSIIDTFEGGNSKKVDTETKSVNLSNQSGGTNEFSSTGSQICSQGKQKDSLDDKAEYLSKSLWVTGLPSNTKALQLKDLFAQHGRVIASKIFVKVKSVESLCFGLVTMSSVEESSKCIEKLHKSQLHENIIEVSKAKRDPTKKRPSKLKSITRNKEEAGHSIHHTSKRTSASYNRGHSGHKSHTRRKDSGKKPNDGGRERGNSVSSLKMASLKSSKERSSKQGAQMSVRSASIGKQSKSLKVTERNIERKFEDSKEGNKDVNALDQMKTDESKEIDVKYELTGERKKKERSLKKQFFDDRFDEKDRHVKEYKERVHIGQEKITSFEKESKPAYKKEREIFMQGKREHEGQGGDVEQSRWERLERERLERRKKKEEQERWDRLERERLERREREQLGKKEQEEIEKKKHERLEWERLERERLKRREHSEKESREREHKGRIAMKDHNFHIEQENQHLEKDRKKEDIDRERHVIMVDRGLSMKRPMPRGDDEREYHLDQKRHFHNTSANIRTGFFLPPGDQNDSAPAQYGNEQYSGDHRYDNNYHYDENRGNKGNSCEPRLSTGKVYPIPTEHDARLNIKDHGIRNEHLVHNEQPASIRRVVPRDAKGDYYNKNRSHHANDTGSKYREGIKSQNALGAPKPLSDVLGRAGLTGILDNQGEKSWMNVPKSQPVDQFNSGGNSHNQKSNRDMKPSNESCVNDYREQNNTRMDFQDNYQRNPVVNEQYSDPYRQNNGKMNSKNNVNFPCTARPYAGMEANMPHQPLGGHNFNGQKWQNNQFPPTGLQPLVNDISGGFPKPHMLPPGPVPINFRPGGMPLNQNIQHEYPGPVPPKPPNFNCRF